jgi:MoxR-like ATPase
MALTEFIPPQDNIFVPFGNYEDIFGILKEKQFLPMLLTGPTGSGKTKMVEQIHAKIQKELIRVNITIESDEDSLMGGFRLKNGETVFVKGPVILAMEIGATLLLDELDLAHPMKIMCLQSVLEGAGYFIKKTGESIVPKSGFCIVATANTKGSGDEDGHYVGTQTLNGAMMDRFPLVFECDYPTKSIEDQIVRKLLGKLNYTLKDAEIGILLDWASQIRNKNINSFEIEYAISTRRICDIIKVNSIYKDLDKSIQMCLNRFDASHKQAFYDIYKALKPSSSKTNTNDDAFQASKIFKI